MKESTEDNLKQNAIIYFSQKLKTRFHLFKKILYGFYLIIFVDIILIPLIPPIFCNKMNILSLIIIILFSIFCHFIFKHNFEIVTYYIYRSTLRVIYSLFAIILIHYCDMFYLLLFRILLNFDELSNSDSSINFSLFATLGFFIYFILNLSLPIIILFKLIQVKRSVKELGEAQGESYDSIPSNEIPESKNEVKIEMRN